MKDFRSLSVWAKAHALTLMTYRTTASFPREEVYGLTAQMPRSSASIATNISEGCGKYGNAEFSRYLQIAMGSAREFEYQILLSRDLQYIRPEPYEEMDVLVREVQKMLASLIRKVNAER